MSDSADRTVVVRWARLEPWAAGFERRHGELVSWEAMSPSQAVLIGADGARAEWFFQVPRASDVAVGREVSTLVEWATQAPSTLVVMLRRGRYAVGVWQRGQLVTHKKGQRYVQGRTAAGGWSQQRFQRRRQNQASALVGATARLVGERCAEHPAQHVVLAGDRGLLRDLVEQSGHEPWVQLPRTEVLGVPAPSHLALVELADTALGATAHIWDTPSSEG